ncbi:MAG: SGNH/GDSL hydrolase family protein [Candidatus Binatia bacterium]
MTTAPSSAVEPRAAETAPRPRRLRSAVRFAAAFALPWILLEIGLRVVGWQPPDMRPRVALFPRFPAFYEPSRELGWVLRPNLDWQGMEVGIPFRTDAEGHRVHGDGSGGTPPAVDAIGDSSTFGFGVPENDTYPAQLERTLRAATGDASLRVRNLGVPGYTSYEARILAEHGTPRAPVTLVMMGFNDHFPATRTRFTSLWVRRAAYACFRSRACALLFDRATRSDPDAPPAPPKIASRYVPDVSPDEYRDQLVRTIRALRADGSEPILLVYPSIAMTDGLRQQIADYWKQPLDQVDANLAAHTQYQQLTREVAAEEKARLVDLPPVFDAAGNVRLHFDWVHPNADGQALIAETVSRPVRQALAAHGSPSNAKER